MLFLKDFLPYDKRIIFSTPSENRTIRKMPYLTYSQTLDLLYDPALSFSIPGEEAGNRTLALLSEDGCLKRITLPFSFPPICPGRTIEEYRSSIPEEPPPQLIILIRSGNAVIGYYEEDQIRTKRFSRYMVRRGHGKAQSTYSRTKGKSRLGSRIRLQQGEKFFREINEKLHEWEPEIDTAETIFISCPVRIRNRLFQGKISPPFSAEDPRIRTVPFTVLRPTIDELRRIRFLLNSSNFPGLT